MGRGQREDNVVFRRCSLELEIELPAELLAKRQAPGAIDAAAIGRMDDQLHAAGFIEETLEDDVAERREGAESGAPGGEIFDHLGGGGLGDADIVGEPGGDLCA